MRFVEATGKTTAFSPPLRSMVQTQKGAILSLQHCNWRPHESTDVETTERLAHTLGDNVLTAAADRPSMGVASDLLPVAKVLAKCG